MTEQNIPIRARAAMALFANRYLLVLGLLIALLAGLSALTNIPRIEDPQITPRYPQVTTILPGASASRIEALISDPIEDSLREISELKKIESTSAPGISIINLELRAHIGKGEIEQVFSKIQNQLKDVASALPPGASQPFFNDKNTAVAFSKVVAITWPNQGEPQLGVMTRLAEDLADVMRSFPGTDLVRVYGAPDEEVAVTIRGDEIAALGLNARSLAALIRSADSKLPAGALRSNERDLFVEVDAQIDSLERIRRIPIRQNDSGSIVTVGDIAVVEKRWREPVRDLTFANGERSILIAARTNDSVRLDKWSSVTTAAIDKFRRDFGGGLRIETVFEQNVYTENRLSTLGSNLGAGALLVMIVVLISMGWRAALIVGSALPLSASLTLFGLSILGQQLHQMAIVGMIIAIGLLIDNAIVMTDEVKQKLDDGATRPAAIQGALAHLFVPLLASTLTTILGFMPVFLLPGAIGDFVGPIAIAVVLALISSFFISMTFVPALGGLFLRRNEDGKRAAWWVDGYQPAVAGAAYKRWLLRAIARPRRTVFVCLILPIAGFFLASSLGEVFFPPADRNQFEVEVRLPPDSSIGNTADTAARIEARIREEAGVTDVHWRVGGSYPTIYYNRIMVEQSNNAYAHAMIYTDGLASARTLTRQLPARLGDLFPEAQIIVAPFGQGPPVDAPVTFLIAGPDTQKLRELGEQVRRIMHTVPGVMQTRATVTGGQPKIEFVPDEFAASQSGFNVTELAGQLQSDLEGQSGGALLEDLEELPVIVRLEQGERDSIRAIESLLLARPDGTWVPVSGLGEFQLRPESSRISRKDGIRTNKVLGFLARDVLAIDVTNAVLARLDEEDFQVPAGYSFTVGGDSAEQSSAFGSLFTYLPVLAMLMVATIILSFRSMRLAGIIAAVAVLSVGLGLLSLWIGGYARGFNAIIGSLGLVGVAINGTIVVLAGIQSNAKALAGDLAEIVRETRGATRHIVSTTLTTVGGFIPLLLFTGGDFWPPLAIVIAGGVAFSITLSLILCPAMYVLTLGRASKDLAASTSIPAAAT